MFVAASTVQSLVVQLDPNYVLTTPIIPGVPLPSTPPLYTISTPVIPGVADDDLDETYLPTTRSNAVYADGAFDVDETLEATTFLVNYYTTPIILPAIFRMSTVQSLTVALDPAEDQTVIFAPVH